MLLKELVLFLLCLVYVFALLGLVVRCELYLALKFVLVLLEHLFEVFLVDEWRCMLLL